MSFAFPRKLIVGGGTISQLPTLCRQLKINKPLVITDKFMNKNTPVIQNLVQQFQSDNMKLAVYDSSIPDPTTDSISSAIASMTKNDTDGVIAIGGGSPIDTAKAACMLRAHGGKLRDYKAPFKMESAGVPLIAVPTTAGTGSEVTQFTVVSDSETGEKMLCMGLSYMPDISVVDYKLTLSKPWRLTADTAIDSLTHAIEAFVSTQCNPISDCLALSSMKTIVDNVEIACNEPGNEPAREKLMMAATQAGMAFSNSSVCLVHGMSRPLGAHFKIPHGLSNAMILPKVTEFSMVNKSDRYGLVYKTLIGNHSMSDKEALAKLPTYLQHLNERLKVPTIEEYGVDRSRYLKLIPTMVEQAIASGSPNKNPRIPTPEELAVLYESVYRT